MHIRLKRTVHTMDLLTGTKCAFYGKGCHRMHFLRPKFDQNVHSMHIFDDINCIECTLKCIVYLLVVHTMHFMFIVCTSLHLLHHSLKYTAAHWHCKTLALAVCTNHNPQKVLPAGSQKREKSKSQNAASEAQQAAYSA